MKKYIPYLVIILGLVFFYFWRYRRAPDLELKEMKLNSLSGQATTVEQIVQGNTILHFYASWCGPCLREMRELKDHFQSFQDSHISFVFVSDDSLEDMQKMKQAMPDEIQFFQIQSLQDAGIYTLPATYFIKNQSILRKELGSLKWDSTAEIESIFKKQ